MLQGRFDIDPVLAVHPTFRIAGSHHMRSVSRNQPGNVRPGVAEPMHCDASTLQWQVLNPACFAHGVETTARSGLVTTLRAAEGDRLAGDDPEFSVSAHHGNGVHDPGHCLLVRINIRRGNIAIGTNDGSNLKGVATSESLEFTLRQALRIADDTTFASTIGDAHRGTLPGHPRCERLYLVESNVRVIKNT